MTKYLLTAVVVAFATPAVAAAFFVTQEKGEKRGCDRPCCFQAWKGRPDNSQFDVIDKFKSEDQARDKAQQLNLFGICQ